MRDIRCTNILASIPFRLAVCEKSFDKFYLLLSLDFNYAQVRESDDTRVTCFKVVECYGAPRCTRLAAARLRRPR